MERVSSGALQLPVAQDEHVVLQHNCYGFQHVHLHVCLAIDCPPSVAQERLWSIIPFLPDGLAKTSEPS